MKDDEMAEYLKRNIVLAKSYGMSAAAEKVLSRLSQHKRQPVWLVSCMRRIIERAPDVHHELLIHRNEKRIFRGEAK